jgi:hypothetical protein
LREVGRRVGVSATTVLNLERVATPGAPPELLGKVSAAVGLRVRIKAYPEGPPIRDAPSVALIREFSAELRGGAAMRVEQAVTNDPNDQRAFDATLDLPGGCGLEFITRFHDCQAQVRAANLKQRAGGLGRLFIVVKDTHANRRAVAAAWDVIETTFPLGTRAVMSALRQGRDPGGNGLVFI